MLSPDPIKRSLNPYPYCENDPVNYVDPTGEIPSILAGGFSGFIIGGAAGFVGSAVSQIGSGRKFDWRKAAGAAANGAVVGAAKGALIGSGAGIPLAFATDFAAGSIGNALEQGITTGRVDLRESLISGTSNALSEVLYGTGEIKGLGNAIWRGALTGAVMSGVESTNYRGLAGAILYDRMHNRKAMPESAGRDPKGMCGSPDPFDLASGLENGRGYHTGNTPSRMNGGSRFSLGGFLKDVATGAVIGGLGSAGFYGVGKAVDALKEHLAGQRNVINPKNIHFMQNSIKNQTGEYTVLGNVGALRSGKLKATDLPEIRIWKDSSGKIWTLDHRRLAAFRMAELDMIPFKWATEKEVAKQMWKMSTKTGGTSIKLKLGNGVSITIQ